MSRGRPALTRGWAALGAAVVVGVGAVGALAISGDSYYGNIAILTFLAVILAVTVRPLLLAGEASLCHGSFYALGAYTVGILAVDHGVSVWLGLPLGGLVAAVGAVLIGVPSLRTTGSYFFLMTFAFLIITNSLFESFEGLTGGFSGVSGIPTPSGVMGVDGFFFLSLGLVLVTLIVFFVFERSRWGLELRGLGDSSALAQAAGASRFGSMLGAFTVGAFFAGVAGGVYASYLTFISPASFSIWLSIYAVTYVVLGGSRYFGGAILGAIALALVPVLFNWSEAYIGIFTSAATLAIILFAPRGLLTEAVEAVRSRVRTDAPEERPASRPAPRLREEVPVVRESAGSALLEISDVSQRFGGVTALEDVSLTVREDEVFGIIGPNGAGKTTLFNVISGFQRPTEGSVRFLGEEIVGVQPHRIVRRGLTRTFQASSVFESLTVFENVLLGARGSTGSFPLHVLAPVRRDKRATVAAEELIELFGLGQWANTPAGDLPYGAGKRLGVTIAMATWPRLLCLDEPMAGLSDHEVEDMREALALVRREGRVTVAIIEHRVPLMMSLCDTIATLNFGRVIAVGTPEEVGKDPAVVEAYLGVPTEVAADA